MPRKLNRSSVERLVKQIDARLRTLNEDLRSLDLRDKVLRLVDLQHEVRDLGVSVVYESGIQATAARERICLYLMEYVGVAIGGDELQVVSGISQYARRVRELRVEQGYQIASGASPDLEVGIDLRPDQYLLVSREPDADACRRWHVANRIRRMNASSQERILAFLRENVGRVVTTEELAYIARVRDYGRRVRELRTEQGCAIATRFTGRPDLGMGQYVLETLDRLAEPHDRHVPESVQRAVFARDKNTCVCCGWSRDRWTREDPRLLELHHIEEHVGGGSNTEENLAVVCSRCHDDVHAHRLRMSKDSGAIRCERIVV